MKNRKRVGRGIGSGKGKTAGRGVKGQKARTGVAIKGFEGGKMPLHRRRPMRGFTNFFRMVYVVVSIAMILEAVEAGRLDAGQTIDAEALRNAGVIRRTRDGVRLLGGAEVTTALTLDVAGASRPAIAAIEQAGGKITVANPAAAAEEAA